MPETEPWAPLLDDERVVHQEFKGAREARPVFVPQSLNAVVRQGLAHAGIELLYEHQADALAAAFEGPTIVTTGTASGKSLCFQLPTLEVLTSDPHARALFIYPTKALAQDQARALNAFGLARQIRPAIYDGDTPRGRRAAIRGRANVVLTNPDMLHVGILPHHHKWEEFFANLAFVVLDEAHTYRGVFGSHVAGVLRRLRRAAAIHGTAPRFLLASATIANPLELAERLTGLQGFTLIDRDAAPRPARTTAIWNPPLLDEELGLRASALHEAAELFSGLIRGGARTICFMKSRKGVELILRHARGLLEPALRDRVAPYRAGYTPAQRQEIQRRLTSGDLLGVVSTDALELGIDIGALDAAICVTYPGTAASLKQMWGRAGRRGRGLAVFVAGEDALDQFFCRHPEEFLARPVEAAIVDPHSPEIYGQHLLCAAHEAPLSPPDAEFFGPAWEEGAASLVEAGLLRERPTGFVPRRAEDYPAARVALRSASPESFALVESGSGELIGTVEASRAYSTVHEGAVYLHLGRSYQVRELDLAGRRALLDPFDGDYYTQAKTESVTWIERLHERREVLGVALSFGSVVVEETVLGYQRKHLHDQEVIDFSVLGLPTVQFPTRALWYELDGIIGAGIPELLGALHALEHAQIAVLPLIAMCDRWDIGGLSINAHPQTGVPTIFIYDGHPGGVGLTRRGYDQFERLSADARRLIAECPCREGCPSCIQSPKCGNLNEPLSKRGALELLARMGVAARHEPAGPGARPTPRPARTPPSTRARSR